MATCTEWDTNRTPWDPLLPRCSWSTFRIRTRWALSKTLRRIHTWMGHNTHTPTHTSTHAHTHTHPPPTHTQCVLRSSEEFGLPVPMRQRISDTAGSAVWRVGRLRGWEWRNGLSWVDALTTFLPSFHNRILSTRYIVSKQCWRTPWQHSTICNVA